MIRFVAALLAVATLCCLPLRPLWVDEIFQLEGTWQQPFPQMLHNAMVAPGGMPLAYAAQKVWLDVAGFSIAQARLPAAVFGLGSALLLLWWGRELALQRWLVLLFAFATPLLFRYTTEARPYAQGLFFSLLSSVLLLRWLQNPSRSRLAAYACVCLAAVYSQPFALFTACAHAVYLAVYERKRLWPVAGVVLVTGALYAPWVVFSHQALATESWPHEMFFSFRQVSPLLLIREIAGGGYICSVPLLILAAAGWRDERSRLLVFCMVIPIGLAVAADAAFNYFFAIRQLIFVVPPLLLMAALGWHRWQVRHCYVAYTLAAVYIAGALVKDVRWQQDRREDWAAAAHSMAKEQTRSGGCIEVEPAGDARHYQFFLPELRGHTCRSGEAASIYVVSPYAATRWKMAARNAHNVGNSLIEVR